MATTREEIVVKMGLDTSDLQRRGPEASEFMGKLGEKMGKKLDRVFYSILGVGFIGQLKEFIKDAIDVASKAISELVFQNERAQKIGLDLDKRRQMLHRMREEQAREQAAIAKQDEEFRKQRIQDEEKLANLTQKSNESAMSDYDLERKRKEQILYLSRAIAEQESRGGLSEQEMADLAADRLRLKQYELDLDRLQQKQRERDVQFNKDINKRQGEKRQTLRETLSSPQFQGALGQIAALESDAAEAMKFGNRTRALADLKIADDLRRQIQQSIRPELNPQQNPQERVIQSILDHLFPSGQQSGIPVNVTNTD